MVWHESEVHSTECYFCLVNTKGIGKKKTRLNISYPSIPSAIRPVLHTDEFPPPIFNGFISSDDEETESEEKCMECEYKRTDTESEDSSTEVKKATPQQFNQSELNDLVRDLDLSKQAAELLASRLNEKHVLHSSAKVSFFRRRDESFLSFFKEEKQLVYCDNVPGLLSQLGIPAYNPKEWRLFWTAPNAASSVCFYTMGIVMELFLLVTPLC